MARKFSLATLDAVLAVGLAMVLAVGGLVSPPLRAQETGFYIGATAGQGTTRINDLGYSRHDLGWSIMAGFRPLPMVGAEVSYFDLGRPDNRQACYFSYCSSDFRAHSQGGAAFGMLYLPIPHTLLELYGKAGAARVDTWERGTWGPPCGIGRLCPLYVTGYDHDISDTQFAWGAGAQIRWWNLSFRAEFEQFQAFGGHPNLASAGVIWKFF